MHSKSENNEILEVDEGTLIVTTITSGGRRLKARTPMVFTVKFDLETQSYDAEGPFDVVSGARTRPELEQNLQDELAMLWREYALADPAILTLAAQRLRVELLAAFEATADAA